MSNELFDQPVLAEAKIAFRDLRVKDPQYRQELLTAVEDVLKNGPLLMGVRVEQFEQEIARFCGRREGIGVSSGTSALFLALKALGVGAGDEVITSPMSWVATLNAIVAVGAKPVFVDVGKDQNIDPSLIPAALTPQSRAIVPVHFTGRLCDMRTIMKLAQDHGLLVIEDAAQAVGAQSGEVKAGSHSDAAAFSLNPMKVFPGFGEAGAIVTDDPRVAERIRALRYLGTHQKEICREVSLNHKMDEIQAALLLLGFGRLDSIISRRISLAKLYAQRLSRIANCSYPAAPADRSSNFFDYVITVDDRDGLRRFLASKGIETKVKHPVLLCDHPAYAVVPRPHIPVADRLVSKMLSLPFHDLLTEVDLDYICNSISEYVDGRQEKPT